MQIKSTKLLEEQRERENWFYGPDYFTFFFFFENVNLTHRNL